MNAKNTSISVLILGYSLFGSIGLISTSFSASPIIWAIGSSLTLFAYSSIAILSKRITFKQLFITLIPLNIINAIASYAKVGLLYLKYQPIYDLASKYSIKYMEVSKLARENNITLTEDYLNNSLGPDLYQFRSAINRTSNKKIDFLEKIPNPVYYTFFAILVIYVSADFILGFIQNMVSLITYPIVMVISMLVAVHYNISIVVAYFVPQIWLPIAATIDSFLRIYILRGIFVRFLRTHPLIKQYLMLGEKNGK